MGCHTWFYKPCTRSYEEQRVVVIKNLTVQIEKFTDKNYIEQLLIQDWTETDIESHHNFYKRWLKRIQSGRKLWYAAIYSDRFNYFIDLNYLTEYHQGIFYIESSLHNIFRVSDYPDDRLLSIEDVVAFCTKRGIDLPQKDYQKIAQWYLSKPEGGLIRFG